MATMKLTRKLNFKLTKKRLEIMSRKSNRVFSSIKLSVLLPLLVFITLIYCTRSIESDLSSLALSIDSVIQNSDNDSEFIESKNYYAAGPKPLFADTTLYFRKNEINVPERKIYAKNGDLFTGTQNWFYDTDGSLDQSIEIENGKIMIATRFHNDGSEFLKATFDEQNGDTTFQRFYENGILESTSKNWSYQKESIIYSFSKGEDAEGDTFYSEQETSLSTAYTKTEMFRNGLPFTLLYRDDEISTVKSYHENGQLRSEGTAKNNGNTNYFFGEVVLHGLQATYTEKGAVVSKELWENGELVETIE